MRGFKAMETASFFVSVIAGASSAVAGWQGWTITSVITGCLAAIAPIAGRFATNRLSGPRRLTVGQFETLKRELRKGAPFKIWVAHNRHEAEPRAFHADMVKALKASGLEAQWFGGMTNSTVGIEVSGPEGPEKDRIFSALKLAGIPYQPIVFTDQGGPFTEEVAIWIGTHPER